MNSIDWVRRLCLLDFSKSRFFIPTKMYCLCFATICIFADLKTFLKKFEAESVYLLFFFTLLSHKRNVLVQFILNESLILPKEFIKVLVGQIKSIRHAEKTIFKTVLIIWIYNEYSMRVSYMMTYNYAHVINCK